MCTTPRPPLTYGEIVDGHLLLGWRRRRISGGGAGVVDDEGGVRATRGTRNHHRSALRHLCTTLHTTAGGGVSLLFRGGDRAADARRAKGVPTAQKARLTQLVDAERTLERAAHLGQPARLHDHDDGRRFVEYIVAVVGDVVKVIVAGVAAGLDAGSLTSIYDGLSFGQFSSLAPGVALLERIHLHTHQMVAHYYQSYYITIFL